MRLTLTGFATLAFALLYRMPAEAEPLILRCVGNAISASPYERTATSMATQRYYRVDQQQFSRFMPSDVVWPANRCATKRAACSIDEDAFTASWMNGGDQLTVQINRKTGRVIEKDGWTEFLGDCAPGPDPAQAAATKKF